MASAKQNALIFQAVRAVMFDGDKLLKTFNEVAHALVDERGLLGRIRAEHDELKVAESVIADIARLRAAARTTEVPPVAQKKEEDTTRQQQQSEDNVESPPKKDVIDDPVERMLSRAREALMAEKLERKIDRPSYKRETARRVGKIEEARDSKIRGKENTKSGVPSSTARKPPERPGVSGTADPGDLKSEARDEGEKSSSCLKAFIDESRIRVNRCREETEQARRRAFGHPGALESPPAAAWDGSKYRMELLQMCLPLLRALRDDIGKERGRRVFNLGCRIGCVSLSDFHFLQITLSGVYRRKSLKQND
ncbi:hypothetical protein FOZ60_009333 [Perkinsus olseni]|uniref:Uncharacterized protein n=1 Tax=Perkinsus olseni TaxID=32597 RepID=A0A7J6NHK1_PEROL|nr:hypothetical protein FOZ60_009333 [Perkinsus olseni]